MTEQGHEEAPITYWVETEWRSAIDSSNAWLQCCVIEFTTTSVTDALDDGLARHQTGTAQDHRVSVWATSKFTGGPVARRTRTWTGTDADGPKYTYETEFPAQQADSAMGAGDGDVPKDGPQTTTPTFSGMPTETPAGENGAPETDSSIDRAAAAGEGMEPPASAFQMVTEDQLKQAAIELEEALRNVMHAHQTLNRKGPWWCYQDALEAVARTSAVLSAAYLNWLTVS